MKTSFHKFWHQESTMWLEFTNSLGLQAIQEMLEFSTASSLISCSWWFCFSINNISQKLEHGTTSKTKTTFTKIQASNWIRRMWTTKMLTCELEMNEQICSQICINRSSCMSKALGMRKLGTISRGSSTRFQISMAKYFHNICIGDRRTSTAEREENIHILRTSSRRSSQVKISSRRFSLFWWWWISILWFTGRISQEKTNLKVLEQLLYLLIDSVHLRSSHSSWFWCSCCLRGCSTELDMLMIETMKANSNRSPPSETQRMSTKHHSIGCYRDQGMPKALVTPWQ